MTFHTSRRSRDVLLLWETTWPLGSVLAGKPASFFTGITHFQQVGADPAPWGGSKKQECWCWRDAMSGASPNLSHIRNVSQSCVSSSEVFHGKRQIILTSLFNFNNIKGASFGSGKNVSL